MQKVNYQAKNPIKTEQKRRRKLKYLKLTTLSPLNSIFRNNLRPNGPNYLPYQPPIQSAYPQPNNYPLQSGYHKVQMDNNKLSYSNEIKKI